MTRGNRIIYNVVKYTLIGGICGIFVYKIFTEPKVPPESYLILLVAILGWFLTIKRS
jgi:hypothetical protein